LNIEWETAMEFIDNLTSEDWNLIWIILFGIFILIIILGMTNRVVIFEDISDFMWTMGIVLIPLIWIMVLAIITPENTPDSYNIFWTTVEEKVVTVVFGLGTLGSVAMTYLNSIKSNGIVLGLIIGTSRVIASVIILFMILGLINKFFEEDSPPGALIVVLIVTWVFGFVIKRLINGERVYDRRMAVR
jgi:hypothetical protein